MTELETRLQDALDSLANEGLPLSGPALRRRARRQSLQIRTGGLAAIGATGAAVVLVAPGLMASSPTVAGHAGASTTATALPAAPLGTVPVQPSVWTPAGALIDNATVLSATPKRLHDDSDWLAWSHDLALDASTVSVVFADRATLDNSGPRWPRPLVIATGRTSSTDPTLRICALTTESGGDQSVLLGNLTVIASAPVAAQGPQAIAAFSGIGGFVAADGGITSAEYAYTDGAGTHTAAMKLENGVATALWEPAATAEAPTTGAPRSQAPIPRRTVTRVLAKSGDTVVWDGPPVASR